MDNAAINPNKKLGQHWLNDYDSLLAMADSAEVAKKDFVLEIGPGLGSLTQVLIDKGAVVWAVELDKQLSARLASKISDPHANLKIIGQNILKFDFNQLPADYKIVANIPYYLTSHLLRIISESDNPPSAASLLLQKEVAQRVCAKPGQMSLLSVSTQMYFETGLGRIIPADLFIPSPKVDSQILILKRRKNPLFDKQNPVVLFRVVKAGFSERRKKLRSSISGGLRISKEQADKLLKQSKISPDLRAQNLSLENWLAMAKAWQEIKF
jgi:16S rRNA (adenine1518-N6/adenine1519-N6)-dimethyltransferase